MAVGMLLKQLRSSGEKYGLKFADMTREANSRNALLVQMMASEKGLGHKFSNLVYKSFFEEGLNISLAENVIQIGLSIGLIREEMLEVMASEDYLLQLEKNLVKANENNINKFPTFVINDVHIIVGSPNEKKLRVILESIV